MIEVLGMNPLDNQTREDLKAVNHCKLDSLAHSDKSHLAKSLLDKDLAQVHRNVEPNRSKRDTTGVDQTKAPNHELVGEKMAQPESEGLSQSSLTKNRSIQTLTDQGPNDQTDQKNLQAEDQNLANPPDDSYPKRRKETNTSL
jgi:hypothetical protein